MIRKLYESNGNIFKKGKNDVVLMKVSELSGGYEIVYWDARGVYVILDMQGHMLYSYDYKKDAVKKLAQII